MIVRLVAVDPRPRVGSAHDIVVYQVPERSREFELLTELFGDVGIEWEVFETVSRKKKGDE